MSKLKFCPLINDYCRTDCVAYIPGYESTATNYIGMGEQEEIVITIETKCLHYKIETQGVK